MKDVIIVGCGIVGATVAQAMRMQGRDVLVVDDGRPMGGTGASGGHLRHSWFGDMKKEQYEPALALLDEVWGLLSHDFIVYPKLEILNVFRVDTDKVLGTLREVRTVTTFRNLDNYPIVQFADGTEERARMLLVAAGVWCQELLHDMRKVTAKQGISFRIKGKINQPFIRPWAPYKQIVVHQQSEDELWVGDGSAILPQKWSESRTKACLDRCRDGMDRPNAEVRRTISGLRPYCEPENAGDPCLFKAIGPRAWVATGAGKKGTIAAGWVAKTLLGK